MALIGLRPSIVLATMSAFIFFSSLPFLNTSADLTMHSNIDNAYQGRVWGLIGLISQQGYIVAFISAGVIADKIMNSVMIDNTSLLGKMI